MSLSSAILAKRPALPPTCGLKLEGKCPDPMDLWHRQCCHFAVVFDKLTPHVEFQSIRGRIVPKLSENVKVAEATKILGVSPGTVRTWAEAGKIPMQKNPANGYRLFRRDDLLEFLERIATGIKHKHASETDRSVQR